MNQSELVILRVGQEFEAGTAVSALGEGGVPAYKKAVPNEGLLAFPGAYGLSENGYDVVIRPEHAQKAAQILVGVGFEPTVESDDADDTVQADDEEAKTEQPEENTQVEQLSTGKRILLGIVSLLLIAGCVWLVDYIVNAIKGLFM